MKDPPAEGKSKQADKEDKKDAEDKKELVQMKSGALIYLDFS